MRGSTAVSVACVAVTLLVSTSAAEANDIWAAKNCQANVASKQTFKTTERVCVAGDVDSPCSGTIVGAADIFVVPTGITIDKFRNRCVTTAQCPTRVTTAGGAGGFWGKEIWKPPLKPGTYDLVLDENCNTMWDPTTDVHVEKAFTVKKPAGPLMCPDRPPEWGYVAPDIASGATCRGACGAGCDMKDHQFDPGNLQFGPPYSDIACKNVGSKQYCIEGNGDHAMCTYDPVKACGTHAGCRTHDECYDECYKNGLPLHACKSGCDIDCIKNFNPFYCYSWMYGGGPFSGTINYVKDPDRTSNPGPTRSSTNSGTCP